MPDGTVTVSETRLANYDTARRAIAECARLDEAADIRNKAEALAAYAKQKDDPEMEAWIGEIKVRASIRIGELSRELKTTGGAGGGRPRKDAETSSHRREEVSTKAKALDAAGISKSAAQRYEEVAGRPNIARATEIYFEECKEAIKPPTFGGLRDFVRKEFATPEDEAFSSIIQPDDSWNFSKIKYERIDGEDGIGYIPGDLYANCLWYYTKPGDVVAAPMAGAGQIMRVYEDRAVWARPKPWELDIRMSDLSPRGPYADRMKQHDLRESFPVDRADYIVMDVPYFGMVDGQYSKLETDIANMNMDGWTEAIGAIAQNCAMAQSINGLCTVISPNYLDMKTGRKIITTDIVMTAFRAAGYEIHDKAYASRRVQQNQGPNMGRWNNQAKRSKRTLTDIAEVMTFRRI